MRALFPFFAALVASFVFFGCQDDTVIGTRVKSALIGDDRVKARHINVDVFKGVVQLSGFVESEEQILAAEEIAADVPGVIDVKNRIDLRGN